VLIAQLFDPPQFLTDVKPSQPLLHTIIFIVEMAITMRLIAKFNSYYAEKPVLTTMITNAVSAIPPSPHVSQPQLTGSLPDPRWHSRHRCPVPHRNQNPAEKSPFKHQRPQRPPRPPHIHRADGPEREARVTRLPRAYNHQRPTAL
jgi:hypothetical protein